MLLKVVDTNIIKHHMSMYEYELGLLFIFILCLLGAVGL